MAGGRPGHGRGRVSRGAASGAGEGHGIFGPGNDPAVALMVALGPAPARGRMAGVLRVPLAPRDPAPSRLTYRLHRLWLTPLFRAVLKVGLPAYALVLGVGVFLSDIDRRAAVTETFETLRSTIEERPEFMVETLRIEGASPAVHAALAAEGPGLFPVSSFRLDLTEMRARMEAFDAVERADLRVLPGGVLEVRVTERVPAVVWRSPAGWELLDGTGHRIAFLVRPEARADLPVIAGEGADGAVPEALVLIATAAALGDRLRGLERIGERRWDVVLTRGPRIMLPEAGAVTALERALALARAGDLLERDVAAIDLRHAQRPVLRLNPDAVEELRRIRALETGAVRR